LPVDDADLQSFRRGDLIEPIGQREDVGERRGELHRGVVHEVELSAVAVPRTVGPDRHALTRPVRDAARCFPGGEVRANGLGEGGDPLDHGAAFGAVGRGAHVRDGPLGGDPGLALAADGDDDIAHGIDCNARMPRHPPHNSTA
jgi:hypothetical protein